MIDTTAVVKKEGGVMEYLKANMALIEEAARGSGINAKQMMEITIHCLRNNPKLMGCSRGSFLSAVLTATNLGLFPDPVLGEVFLVPFQNRKEKTYDVQAIVGYKGLVKLLLQSGFVLDIEPREVYANDTFEYEYGLYPKLKHVPTSGDRGEVIGYYVVVTLESGIVKFHYMTAEEARKHGQKFTKSKDENGRVFGVWKDHEEAMAKKTCLKQAIKYLPLTPKLVHTITSDEVRETGETVDVSPAGIPIIPESFYEQTSETATDKITGEVTPNQPKSKGIKGLQDKLESLDIKLESIDTKPESLDKRSTILTLVLGINENDNKASHDYISRMAVTAADELNLQLPTSKLAKTSNAFGLLQALDDKIINGMYANLKNDEAAADSQVK